ncbi:MAG: 50S ribosomal protein L29 [Patescibacteria group bacterium]|jgi:ribosomal protein L29
MKFNELKDKSTAELQKLLKADREALRDLRFKAANKQLKNVRLLGLAKKGIARILTLLNNRPADKSEIKSA